MSDTETKKKELTESFMRPPEKTGFSRRIRWLALLFSCLLVFGNEYIMDIPAAIQTELQNDVGITEFEYSLLFTVYAAPNVVLPFFGGLLVDFIGIKISTIIFTILSLIGQSVFATGCHFTSYPLLILGRIIIGMGGECLTVAQSFIVSLWFREEELSLSLGISVFVAKTGTVFNSLISPKLYNANHQLVTPAIAGVFVCVLSFLSGLILLSMNGIRKRLKKETPNSSVIPRRQATPDDSHEKGNHEKVNLRAIRKLPLPYWMLFLIALTYEPSFYAFMNVSNQYFQTRFGFNSDYAGDLLIIPYVVAGVCTPAFGWWADKKGDRLKLILFASVLLVFSHIIYAFMPDCDQCFSTVFPLVLFGVFYAVYTSIFYSSVPILVQRNALGTAYGILTAGLNIGMGLAPIIVGAVLGYYEDLKDTDDGYKMVSYVLSAISLVGVVVGYSLFKIDKKTGSRLDFGRSFLMENTKPLVNPDEIDGLTQDAVVDVKKESGKNSFEKS